MPDDCCFVKNFMKPRDAEYFPWIKYIYIYIIYIYIYIYIYISNIYIYIYTYTIILLIWWSEKKSDDTIYKKYYTK